jgi:hypothetical protein
MISLIILSIFTLFLHWSIIFIAINTTLQYNFNYFLNACKNSNHMPYYNLNLNT